MSSVNLIAFGTFGNPNGFTQTFFAGNPLSVKTFDIRGSVLIYPGSTLYSIRKEYRDGSFMISYAVYTFAKEPSSAREGSFVGSGILFIDEIAEENITIRCLNEFHENLVSKNVENGTLTVNHSDLFSVNKLADFDKIKFNLRRTDMLDSAEITNRQLMVYCETKPSALQVMFKKSLDLLNVYDTIYFTSSKEIAEFVHQKNIFQFVQKDGFENEIRKLAEERKRKILETIADFEKEKSRLGDTEKQVCEDMKDKIGKNKQQHAANAEKIAESEKNLTKISEVYQAFSLKIDELVNRLKTADSTELPGIRQAYNENRSIFTEQIRVLKIPDLATVSDPRPASRPEPFRQQGNQSYRYERERTENKDQLDPFKIATAVLSVLLVAAILWLGWLYWEQHEKEKQRADNQNHEQTNQNAYEKDFVAAIPLKDSPAVLQSEPNAEVDFQIISEMNQKLKADTNLKIDSVAGFVFKANPESIEKPYGNQRSQYAKLLFQKNKTSFTVANGDTIYIGNLQYVPMLK